MIATRLLLALVTLSLAVAGCGGRDAQTAAKPATAQAPAAKPTIVGRWERMQTCAELVGALDHAGLKAIAPGVVGDFFPDASPAQLARKPDLCSGAKPHAHSHFFTPDRKFGSVDNHGEQVDDGSYRVIDNRTLQINEGRFNYRLRGPNTLILTPLISTTARRKALAKPLDFSTAGWQVAVSYGGLVWKRVGCDDWC